MTIVPDLPALELIIYKGSAWCIDHATQSNITSEYWIFQ